MLPLVIVCLKMTKLLKTNITTLIYNNNLVKNNEKILIDDNFLYLNIIPFKTINKAIHSAQRLYLLLYLSIHFKKLARFI